MSEKFVVGQWVTVDGYDETGRIQWIKDAGHIGNVEWLQAKRASTLLLKLCQPFLWQVGRTYRTTLDGVTATVDAIVGGLIMVDCDWRHPSATIQAATFNVGTGLLLLFETRNDVPHLLPYLAESSPTVAEAATYSEFADADECGESDALQSLLAEFVAERNLCDEQIAMWQVKLAEWKVAIRKVEQAIERAKR